MSAINGELIVPQALDWFSANTQIGISTFINKRLPHTIFQAGISYASRHYFLCFTAYFLCFVVEADGMTDFKIKEWKYDDNGTNSFIILWKFFCKNRFHNFNRNQHYKLYLSWTMNYFDIALLIDNRKHFKYFWIETLSYSSGCT